MGRLFMSLIHTCELDELQRHAEELKKAASEWMPWNYCQTPARLAMPADAQYDRSRLAEKDRLRPGLGKAGAGGGGALTGGDFDPGRASAYISHAMALYRPQRSSPTA